MKNSTHPYEVATEAGGRAFLTIVNETGAFAFPWHSISGMRLSPAFDKLTIALPQLTVEVVGRELGDVFELATASRLKTLREGESDKIAITGIRIFGAHSE